jgi:hypothetical protein
VKYFHDGMGAKFEGDGAAVPRKLLTGLSCAARDNAGSRRRAEPARLLRLLDEMPRRYADKQQQRLNDR